MRRIAVLSLLLLSSPLLALNYSLRGDITLTDTSALGLPNTTHYLKRNEALRHTGLAARGRALGMVIPIYRTFEFNADSSGTGFGPNRTNPNWWFRKLCDAIKRHPELQYYCIVNPDNGPGTETDNEVETAIRWLHGSGAAVLMYNTTGYTVWYHSSAVTWGRNSAQMKAAIDTTLALYPEVDGVFFDEVPYYTTTISATWPAGEGTINGPRAMACLDSATSYANLKGLFTIGNPGSYQQNNAYYENGVFDMLIARETNKFDQSAVIEGRYAIADTNSLLEINQHRKAAIAHTTLRDSTYEQLMRNALRYRKYHDFQWMFVDSVATRWGGSLPWNSDGFANWVERTAQALKAQYTFLAYDSLRVGPAGLLLTRAGRVRGVARPDTATDAATKAYTDSLVGTISLNGNVTKTYVDSLYGTVGGGISKTYVDSLHTAQHTTLNTSLRDAVRDTVEDASAMVPAGLWRFSNKVAVGANAADSTFTVTGTSRFSGDANFQQQIRCTNGIKLYNNGGSVRVIFGDASTTGLYGHLQWDSPGDYIRLDTDATNGVKIKGNNVAIGNVVPSNRLVVANGSTKLLEVDSVATTRAYGRLMIGAATTDTTTASHMLRLTSGSTYSEVDAGETAFANSSSESMKTAFAPVPVDSIVAALRQMPFPRKWKWKRSVTGDSAAAQREHASVMAGDFYPVARLLKPIDARESILSGDDEIAALVIAVKYLLQRTDSLAVRLADLEQRGIILTPAR